LGDNGDWLCLGTFETSELAARPYDVMVWWLDGPLNFLEVESH
jgi:hypothetical protein